MAPFGHWFGWGWPSWLWIGSPLKFWLWLINRLATWTGLVYAWKRLRATRFAWAWVLLINMLSLGCLGLLFVWLHNRGGR